MNYIVINQWFIIDHCREASTQLVALQLVNAVMPRLTPSQLLYFMPGVVAFASHPAPSCRETMYDVLFWVYDNFRWVFLCFKYTEDWWASVGWKCAYMNTCAWTGVLQISDIKVMVSWSYRQRISDFRFVSSYYHSSFLFPFSLCYHHCQSRNSKITNIMVRLILNMLKII